MTLSNIYFTGFNGFGQFSEFEEDFSNKFIGGYLLIARNYLKTLYLFYKPHNNN